MHNINTRTKIAELREPDRAPFEGSAWNREDCITFASSWRAGRSVRDVTILLDSNALVFSPWDQPVRVEGEDLAALLTMMAERDMIPASEEDRRTVQHVLDSSREAIREAEERAESWKQSERQVAEQRDRAEARALRAEAEVDAARKMLGRQGRARLDGYMQRLEEEKTS